jgi:hypothetical protein
MKKQRGLLRLSAAAGLAVLACLAAPVLSRHPEARALSLSLRPAPTEAAECEGDACGQVLVTFDESKQQYKVQNNSADRWVRVAASNPAASASACAAPGKVEYLALKNIAGAYRAAYVESGCDMHAGGGPPL